MRDFDQQRRERAEFGRDDRTFVLGGETFVVKASIRPEALAEYENLKADDGAGKALEVIDDLVVSFLEPADDAEARYRHVRTVEDNPISLGDLEALVEWLVETQTKRPTGQPGSSSASPGHTGNTSTENSSLQAVPA